MNARRRLVLVSPSLLLAWVAVAPCAGCGASAAAEGSGDLVLRVTGEEAVVEGFPIEEDGEFVEFADGWSVRFDAYWIAWGEVRLESDGTRAVEDRALRVIDLTRGPDDSVRYADVPARRWEQLGFSVRAPVDGEVEASGADSAVRDRMADAGWNYLVSGTGTSSTGSQVTFEWGIDNPTRSDRCTSGLDGTDGVVIRNNTTTVAELTVHTEHAFWDKLGSEQVTLRFEAIAAADGLAADQGLEGGGDGHVTAEELALQRLSDPRGLDGEPLRDASGELIAYDAASEPLGDRNLWEFIRAAMTTQVHYNGAGLCTTSKL